MKRNIAHPKHFRWDALFSPVDAASIVFFRVTFGLLMAWNQLHFVLGSRLDYRYVQPLLLFKYPGFEWVERASEGALKLIFWALFALALCIALGLWYRIAAALFAFGYLYVFLLDQAAYNNHYYLVGLISFSLIFIPAHADVSLDAIRRRQPTPTVPAWAVWLLRFHIALPYFFGGVAKLNYDWLARAQPMRLWLTTGGIEEAYRFRIFYQPWAAFALSWGGMLFDLLIVPLLLWRRTRLVAYLLAVGFSLNNAFMFSIGFFPWLMICATTIFFPFDWPRRLKWIRQRAPEKKRRHTKERKAPRQNQAAEPSLCRRRLALAALTTYVAVQLMLPLRHFLYPGYVDWTEEGHRFAWRMKLRDKRGKIQFIAISPSTRQAIVLKDPQVILTSLQWIKMIHHPEMIRQVAHFLADRLREQRGQSFEIRVLTSLSLNGRKPQPIIDPYVDLAAQPVTPILGTADWILPLEK